MNANTESTTLRLNGRRGGSMALHEPFEELASGAGDAEKAWRVVHVQSSAVSPYGVAWGLAIIGAMGTESESLTPVHVLGMAVSQYVSSEAVGPTQRAKRAVALLDEWLADDSAYDEQAWPELKESLDRDRLSSRRFFDG